MNKPFKRDEGKASKAPEINKKKFSEDNKMNKDHEIEIQKF